MEAQLFDNSFNEFFDSKRSSKSDITDLESILVSKRSALSSMDFLEDETDHFEEEEEEIV